MHSPIRNQQVQSLFFANMEHRPTLTSAPKRKRGRPSGANRTPLSLEERRARNAQYERERRSETAEAMLDLAAAVGCAPNIPAADLLANVVNYLHSAGRRPSEDNKVLKHCNAGLEQQIRELEQRLAVETGIECENATRGSYSGDCDFKMDNSSNDRKRMKLESEASWEPTSSPPEPQWSQHSIPDHNSTTLEVPISEEETVKIELNSEWNLDHLQNWSVEDFICEYL